LKDVDYNFNNFDLDYSAFVNDGDDVDIKGINIDFDDTGQAVDGDFETHIFPINIDADSSRDVGGVNRATYVFDGIRSIVSHTGDVQSTSGAVTRGGYFQSISVPTSIDATSTYASKGLDAKTTGNLGTTGTTSHTGIDISVFGTADNNFGLRFNSVQDATNNYDIESTTNKDWVQRSDSAKFVQGFGLDVARWFDGTDWRFDAQVGSPFINFTDFGGYRFDDGAVGIGKHPTAKFDVIGDKSITSEDGQDGLNITGGAGYGIVFANAYDGGDIWLTGGQGGGIGIGNGDGGDGGDLYFQGGQFGAGSGGADGNYGNVLLAYERGNVGIGTTSPTYKLEVNGSVFIEDDLNITGKIHNSLSHMYGLATKIHSVANPGTWYNITMNTSVSKYSEDTLTFQDDNITLILGHDGHYTITFGMGFQCSNNNNVDVAMRIELNGEEMQGSYVEEDMANNQDNDEWLEHNTHFEGSEGDKLRMQYIASDTCITIQQDDTYATQPFSAFGYLQEVII